MPTITEATRMAGVRVRQLRDVERGVVERVVIGLADQAEQRVLAAVHAEILSRIVCEGGAK
jgi:hypothetical protein